MRGERFSDATSENSKCTPAAMRGRVKFAKEIECVDQPVMHTPEEQPLDIDKQPDEGHTEVGSTDIDSTVT